MKTVYQTKSKNILSGCLIGPNTFDSTKCVNCKKPVKIQETGDFDIVELHRFVGGDYYNTSTSLYTLFVALPICNSCIRRKRTIFWIKVIAVIAFLLSLLLLIPIAAWASIALFLVAYIYGKVCNKTNKHPIIRELKSEDWTRKKPGFFSSMDKHAEYSDEEYNKDVENICLKYNYTNLGMHTVTDDTRTLFKRAIDASKEK